MVDEYWLQSFSPPEVQRLISGDDVDLGMNASHRGSCVQLRPIVCSVLPCR